MLQPSKAGAPLPHSGASPRRRGAVLACGCISVAAVTLPRLGAMMPAVHGMAPHLICSRHAAEHERAFIFTSIVCHDLAAARDGRGRVSAGWHYCALSELESWGRRDPGRCPAQGGTEEISPVWGFWRFGWGALIGPCPGPGYLVLLALGIFSKAKP
jgi:hypothetical protein